MQTQMTDEQVRARSREKVDQVKALCKELQVSFSAKERITPDMMIEKVVVFTDEENYPLITREPEAGETPGAVVPENITPPVVDEPKNEEAPAV